MAISEDTAALVAAQLTVAWATRAGVPAKPQRPHDESIVAQYLKFREVVREAIVSRTIGED